MLRIIKLFSFEIKIYVDQFKESEGATQVMVLVIMDQFISVKTEVIQNQEKTPLARTFLINN